MLSDDQLLRYARNILLKDVDLTGQQRLLNSHVAVIGAGGLGSPVLQYLAATGVGTLSIIDHDVVDETNLQRQVIHDSTQLNVLKVDSARDYIARLNPEIKVITYPTQLSKANAMQVLSGVDLVVIGTDSVDSRAVANHACRSKRIPLVTGAAIGASGQLTSFDFKHRLTPCFHCVYPHGHNEQQTCATSGVYGPVVGTIGSIMAMEAVKILLNIGHPLFSQLLTWDALTLEWQKYNYFSVNDCPECGGNPNDE